MKKQKDWVRPECNCCHHYSDECRRGVCFWKPNNKHIPGKSKAESAYLFLT